MMTLALDTIVVLLAACSSLTTAGPVPRHDRRQLFATYSNTSSHVSSTTQAVPTYQSVTGHSPSPVDSGLIAHAETALIVQPIQQSVFTSIIPAVTFQNLEGKNIATEDAQTVLSTAYITLTPTPPPPSQEIPSPSPYSSSAPSSGAKPGKSSVLSPSSRGMPIAPSNSLAAVEKTTASETSQRIPSFTYSPEEDSAVSSAASTAIPTSESLIRSSGGLPGFNHPSSHLPGSSVPTSIPTTSNSSAILSNTPTIAPSLVSSSIMVPTAAVTSQPSPGPDTDSKVFVTETQYTTVYPSPSSIGSAPQSQAIPLESATPSKSQSCPPAEQSSSGNAAVVTSSSTAAPVPTASLQQPPPVVIVTQYTTVAPVPESGPTQTPEGSSIQVPLTSSASINFPGPPAPSSVIPPPQPIASSQAPGYSPVPPASQSTALPPVVTPSSIQVPQAPASTTQPAPAPTGAPSAPPAAPTPSPTSEGPLVVMPIPPSQIFTVTVTATDTIRETTTITVTA